ncbi:MAG: hypothetical protein QOE01_725 [Actinomycetota bacterium]|nr:hypothetical protein [Actinomycetota bacterium]
MLWALLWTVLGLGALVVLFLVVRRTWRKARALISEMGTASDRLAAVAAVAAAIEELADPAQHEPLASRSRRPRTRRRRPPVVR